MNKFSNFNTNKNKGAQVKQQLNKNPFSKVDPDDFEPRRMGLIYSPPTIILEYMVPSTGKLYHHKLKLLKLQYNSNNDEFIEYLRKRHANYLFEITDEQLDNLINRLKDKLKLQQNQNQKPKNQQTANSKISTKTQENNFTTNTTAGASVNAKQKLAPLAPLNVNSQNSTNLNSNNTNKQKPQKKNDWGDDDEDELEGGYSNNNNNHWGASKTSNNFYPQNDVKNKLAEKQENNNNQKFYKSSEGFYDGDKDYHTYDLNKLDNEQLKKEKQKMDQWFSKNQKKPGDKGFVYDVQEDFEPYEENEWDEDIEEDIV